MLLAGGISAIGLPMPPPPNSNAGYTASIRIVPWVVLSSFLVRSVGTFVAAYTRAQGGTCRWSRLCGTTISPGAAGHGLLGAAPDPPANHPATPHAQRARPDFACLRRFELMPEFSSSSI